MVFERFFEGTSWPKANERIGVMSVESLDRQWMPVAVEGGYLVAKSKDGKAALLGRMCKRDDGKFCIEVVVRTAIESNELRHYEFWHADPTDEQRHTQRLRELMIDHIGKFQ